MSRVTIQALVILTALPHLAHACPSAGQTDRLILGDQGEVSTLFDGTIKVRLEGWKDVRTWSSGKIRSGKLFLKSNSAALNQTFDLSDNGGFLETDVTSCPGVEITFNCDFYYSLDCRVSAY